MKNFQFIFLRLSLYLIAGILCAFYIEIYLKSVLLLATTILAFYILALIRARKNLYQDAVSGIFTFLLIFILGWITAFLSIPKNQPQHFINQFTQPTDSLRVSGLITEELKPTALSSRFILETQSILGDESSFPVSGKILLNLPKDSTNNSILKPGMLVMLPWTPEEIKAPLNPFQFSYKRYMEQLQVQRQISVNRSQIRKLGNRRNLNTKAWQIREKLITGLKEHNFKKDELAVFQALILGQRRDISDELYKDYAAAGAIHILAISGLHIGILLLFLNFLLKPVENFKYGKIIRPVLVIFLLWGFAFLTGLSPSVVRAVCMFSFIAVGLQLKRKTSSLNSLFLSLFFLLLINPYYIFQVGFQLSYLAVFSIIVFQPLIYRLFIPGNKAMDYFWKLISVSLAAQIGVIPLSLFYFHQFPGLFLASNLVILPFLGVILGFGILVILLISVGWLPEILEDLFGSLLHLMNSFINKIAGIDALVISNIDLSLIQTISVYLIILSLLFFIYKMNYRRLIFFLIAVLIFQGASFQNKLNIPAAETVIFHRPRHSLIAVKEHEKLNLYQSEKDNITIPEDYIRERKIKSIVPDVIQQVLKLSGKLSLIVDTSANYSLKDFKPELLILRNSPKINLERLIQDLSPQEIIADGSNYRSYIERWRKSAREKKIPFHYTGEKGAYIIKN